MVSADDSHAVGPPPLVSIGVPVFNGEDYLPDCLQSLTGQTYPELEILISDNGSSDGTEEICRDVAKRDERVRYHRRPDNLGAAVNYNGLARLATGRYFKWASHDDICAPTLVERCVEELRRHPEAVLAYPRTYLIDRTGSITDEYADRLDLRQPGPTVRMWRFATNVNLCNAVFGLIDRERLLETGLIRPRIGSDVTLLGELLVRGRFHELQERLFYRRIHPRSSRQGELTLEEVAVWFDTRDPQVSRVSPGTRVMGELVQTLLRSPLPARARFGPAIGYVVAWGIRRSRVRVGRARAALREARAS